MAILQSKQALENNDEIIGFPADNNRASILNNK